MFEMMVLNKEHRPTMPRSAKHYDTLLLTPMPKARWNDVEKRWIWFYKGGIGKNQFDVLWREGAQQCGIITKATFNSAKSSMASFMNLDCGIPARYIVLSLSLSLSLSANVNVFFSAPLPGTGPCTQPGPLTDIFGTRRSSGTRTRR